MEGGTEHDCHIALVLSELLRHGSSNPHYRPFPVTPTLTTAIQIIALNQTLMNYYCSCDCLKHIYAPLYVCTINYWHKSKVLEAASDQVHLVFLLHLVYM